MICITNIRELIIVRETSTRLIGGCSIATDLPMVSPRKGYSGRGGERKEGEEWRR